ncbi:MAG: hypothetical protein ACI4CY_03745, partial [Candidatus Gastranaerophilaceae bacterium]
MQNRTRKVRIFLPSPVPKNENPSQNLTIKRFENACRGTPDVTGNGLPAGRTCLRQTKPYGLFKELEDVGIILNGFMV